MSTGKSTSPFRRLIYVIVGLAVTAGIAIPLIRSEPGALAGVPTAATAPVTPSPTGTGVSQMPSPSATPTVSQKPGDSRPLTLSEGENTLGITVAKVTRPQVKALVKQFFPADQRSNAMAVALCESGQHSVQGETNEDGSTDWGIFQLNDDGTLQSALEGIGIKAADVRTARVVAMDARTNVKAAAWIYANRGWAPWVCAYKQAIVAKLYANEQGPLYGKFDSWGDPKPGVIAALQEQQAKAAKEKAAEDAKKNKKKQTSSPSASGN